VSSRSTKEDMAANVTQSKVQLDNLKVDSTPCIKQNSYRYGKKHDKRQYYAS